MSILDDIKGKVSGLLEGHGDKVTEGLDQARSLAEEKAGAVSEQLEGGVQQAKDALDGVAGKNDGS